MAFLSSVKGLRHLAKEARAEVVASKPVSQTSAVQG